MHRNTYLLVIFLAVFAALVVGVNLGKRLSSTPPPTTPAPTPTATPSAALSLLQNTSCGISLQYPATLTLMDSASGSALLVDKKDTNQSVVVTCQKDIPRPALSAENTETIMISSVSAKLYHDASPKDGAAIDELIFRHPTTGMDVFIAGFGETFDAVIKTVKLLP